MKTLNIMTLDFTYKAAIRGYQSAIIKRVWNGIGALELVISEEIPNANLIRENDILWFDREYNKAFIVEHIETELSGSSMSYRITANHLNVLLHDYITIPPAGADTDVRTGSREQVVRLWVDQNCINPDNPARSQYPLALSEEGDFGETITEQSRFAVLSDEIIRVLLPEDLGWRVDLDMENSRYVFRVLDGVNRTSEQSTNSRILFGLRYGNIAGFRKVTDTVSSKTVAFVGGQGDGSTRLLVEIDNSGSGRRKEMFVDAQDVGTANELAERGYQALSDALAVNSFEFEALSRQFHYETDYDLGDFVTVVIDKDTFQHLQIRELKEIYEQGNISVKPVFGTPERTLGKAISGVDKRLSSLASSVAKIDDNKVSPASTWSSEQIEGSVISPSRITQDSAHRFMSDSQISALLGEGTALPGTTGTLTATMNGSIKRITPTGACTFNATGGTLGQRCTFIITTSGTTSYTLTFGTNFKAAGTLATGTISAKMYAVNFIYNGSLWVETGRTAAM